MGTISPRVRRSAACTASWIFRRSSSENCFISPTPGGSAAAEASATPAEAAAESTTSACEPAEPAPSPATSISSVGTSSSATCHHPHEERGAHDDGRSHDGQEQSRREGQHKGHYAPDGAAFPVTP